jgi:hypothetical protein
MRREDEVSALWEVVQKIFLGALHEGLNMDHFPILFGVGLVLEWSLGLNEKLDDILAMFAAEAERAELRKNPEKIPGGTVNHE